MIRMAKMRDLKILRNIAKEVFDQNNWKFYIDLKIMFPIYIKRQGIFVYELKECIVGMVVVYNNSISNLWVLNSHQYKGIGSSLMKVAEKSIIAKGYNSIILDSEPAAIGFYIKNNYVGVKQIRLHKKI